MLKIWKMKKHGKKTQAKSITGGAPKTMDLYEYGLKVVTRAGTWGDNKGHHHNLPQNQNREGLQNRWIHMRKV